MTDLSVDYDEIIHNDTRNGYQESVKVYLEHKPECINKLYRYGESEWTLLLAACYYQHEEIVRMLINQFNADIEAEGTIIINNANDSPRIVRGVSPLWTATAVNNFNIVKFLVEYGMANVNHLTKQQSTPLRSACFNGNIKMIQFLLQHGANPHQLTSNKDTILMYVVYRQFIDLVVYFVDDIKCDINQQDTNGLTALYIAIKCRSLAITKFLLSRGALNLRDKFRNVTPLEWAAIHLKINLVTAFDGYCSDIEWIEARELLASHLILRRLELQNMNMAVEYLTLAFEARASKNIPKFRSTHTLKVFNNRRECETLNDLNQLMSFQSREIFYIEALLIQERILGTSNVYYHASLRHVGNIFADRNQHNICLDLWFYELDLRRKHNIRFDKQDLRRFASLFDTMLMIDKTQMFMNDLCKFLTIITNELSSDQDSEIFDYNLVTLLYLITISAQLLLNKDVEKEHKISVKDGQILIKQIRSIVNKKYITRNSRSSLLHLSCDEDIEALESIVSYPCIMTVRLLVFCGIDVDAMDFKGNTALHILARNSERDDIMAIIDFLHNNAGAHIDFANKYGDSPIEYFDTIPNHMSAKIQRLRQKVGVLPLKCRCARLAKYGRLPYQELLSSSLVKFVKKH